MENKYRHTNTTVSLINYHFVFCPRYRRKIFLIPNVENRFKHLVKYICEEMEIEIIAIECDKDHFHMIFKAKPTLNLPQYIRAVKTITSREIKRTFPEVKQKLWKQAFWSPSYFLTTTGQTTLDILMKYVESQGERK